MKSQPENCGLENELFERIVKLNKDCQYHKLLGITIQSLAPGQANLYIDIADKHLNPQEITHGGVTFSLADTAMGIAVRTLGQVAVTLESNLNYVKPVRIGQTLFAVGNVIKLGQTTTICEAKIFDRDKQLIAVSRGTYYNKGKF